MKDHAKIGLLNDSSFNAQEMLAEAVELVNALPGSLGTKGGKKRELQKALATMNDDKVEMGKPDVFPITDNSFYKKNFPIPVDLSETFSKYQFYYVEFPIGLKTRSNWSFNKYRFFVEFENKDVKVIDMLPSDKFKEAFKVRGNFNAGIDTSLSFKAASPKIKLYKSGAELNAHAKTGIEATGQLNFIKPPFEYSIKKWEIKTAGKDLYYMDWEFLSIDKDQKNESRTLRAILRMPKFINYLEMNGVLIAYRNPDSILVALGNLFHDFNETLRSWFTKGVPIPFRIQNLNLLTSIQDEI